MSKPDQEWFIAERSRALALMHLTRRSDLGVASAGRNSGLDFTVSIIKAGEDKSLRQFGLLLRGVKSATSERDLDRVLRSTMESLQRLGQYPYPVCLLFFTMDDDQGYFTWVAEPEVLDDAPRLVMHGEAHFRKLDRAALDEIVLAVDRWYEAFFGRIVVKAS